MRFDVRTWERVKLREFNYVNSLKPASYRNTHTTIHLYIKRKQIKSDTIESSAETSLFNFGLSLNPWNPVFSFCSCVYKSVESKKKKYVETHQVKCKLQYTHTHTINKQTSAWSVSAKSFVIVFLRYGIV